MIPKVTGRVKKSMLYEMEGMSGRRRQRTTWIKMGGCAGAREAGETAVGETSANPCGYGENGHKRVQ